MKQKRGGMEISTNDFMQMAEHLTDNELTRVREGKGGND